MPYLIGIDEAGYAPNLGPLVIGGTLWKVPEADCDLYHLLRGAVSRSGSARKVAIADWTIDFTLPDLTPPVPSPFDLSLIPRFIKNFHLQLYLLRFSRIN
jgi:hypothetical protein